MAWAFVWPLAWIVYTFVRGNLVDWYPSPLLDVQEIGYAVALRNTGYAVALRNTGFVVILAFVLVAAFSAIERRSRRPG